MVSVDLVEFYEEGIVLFIIISLGYWIYGAYWCYENLNGVLMVLGILFSAFMSGMAIIIGSLLDQLSDQ